MAGLGVQNPDKAPEVAVVIKSSKEGGGKSTLSMVMVRIYGAHSKLIDDSEQLLGKHADNEHVLFVAAEEALLREIQKQQIGSKVVSHQNI